MKIKDILYNGYIQLKDEKIEEPMLKARLLLAHILKVEKEYLIIHEKDEMDNKKIKEYDKCIKKLIEKEPIQYITNHQEFMKLPFYVDENVLIPRADTEILVEEVINYCRENTNKEIKILDMCTGSGIIGISIAKYVSNSYVICTDISNKALDISKRNAKTNEVSNIKFEKSNMFEIFSNLNEQFDIIVSNPPYIKTKVIETLDDEVKKEPKLALDGGNDGLDFYKIIINEAWKHLKTDGLLALEIGYDQKEEVLQLIKNSKYYNNNVCCKKDLGQNNRVIIARRF